MDPPQSDAPTSNSGSFLIPAEKIPRKVRSTSQPSFSEIQNLDLIDFTPGPVSNYFTPLPEELLHLQYREKAAEEERQWERSAYPQRKKTFMGNIRQKALKNMAPYRVEREGKSYLSHGKDQNGCKCHYCQVEREDISKNLKEENSSSWKVMVQGLSCLTLSPDTMQTFPLSKKLPQEK